MVTPLLPLTARHTVAIIGAGISALACAQVLASSGASITLFDKARGPGGRMSSKRRFDTKLDLGAQTFSVRSTEFQSAVDAWLDNGCVATWPTRTYQASSTGWQTLNDGQTRYTGAPSMSALTRYLADSLTTLPHVELYAQTLIASLKRVHNGWQLIDSRGTCYGPYDHVVISAPAPQAYSLVAEWDQTLASVCQTREQRACWAGWAIFDRPLPRLTDVDPDWQMARVTHPALRLVSRNQTKPGRDTPQESLSLLAQLDWSEAHLEDSADLIAEQLVAALRSIFPTTVTLPTPIDVGAHRWRYAQPASPGEQIYLYNANGLALCGDSYLTGRVEDAWLSGHRLGEALINRPL